jgi:hypothetical protein
MNAIKRTASFIKSILQEPITYGDVLRVAVALLIVAAVSGFFSGRAHAQVYRWSQTPGTNANADPHINWAEGQAPSSINDSARAMMAGLAAYRDDISGLVVATGSGGGTTFTATSNQGFSATPNDGQILSIRMTAANGINATLQVDGGTAFPFLSAVGPSVNVPPGAMLPGNPYTLMFSTLNSGWLVRDFYSSTFNIPLGGLLPYTGTTVPNGNFIFPAGQCISTTTYAAYWVLLGSPASGGCPGGQFAVIDLRGRTLAGLDNLNGSAASRLTGASTGCGTAMTSVGAVCANGVEGFATTLAQLPTGIQSGGTYSLSITNVLTNPNGGYGAISYQAGATGVVNVWSTGGIINNNTGVTASGTSTSSNTSGTAHPSVQPTIGVTYLLRVI